MYTNPSVSDFKAFFVRDFPYGTDINLNVLDADISRAIAQSSTQINQELFHDQAEYNIGYLLLSAHQLCLNIQASSQGLSGKFEWAYNSKSVGSVSVGLQIPTSISEKPIFAIYTKTNYGAQYLMMVYPRLTGNMFNVAGSTQA